LLRRNGSEKSNPIEAIVEILQDLVFDLHVVAVAAGDLDLPVDRREQFLGGRQEMLEDSGGLNDNCPGGRHYRPPPHGEAGPMLTDKLEH
jgi:hypothetical protein